MVAYGLQALLEVTEGLCIGCDAGLAAQVFFIFAVITNLLVSLSMLQGCVSVINTLTNIDVYAISFLIPIGVVVYATIGGAQMHRHCLHPPSEFDCTMGRCFKKPTKRPARGSSCMSNGLCVLVTLTLLRAVCLGVVASRPAKLLA